MAIYYRDTSYGISEPASPVIGDIWLKQFTNTDYQAYIYINEWIPFIGSSSIVDLGTADENNKLNIIVQESPPDGIIQTGWLWIKLSVKQVYFYLFGEYIPFVGA